MHKRYNIYKQNLSFTHKLKVTLAGYEEMCFDLRYLPRAAKNNKQAQNQHVYCDYLLFCKFP